MSKGKGNPNKRKGDRFENDIRHLMEWKGINCSRNRLTGERFDAGDILGVEDFTFQCKNFKNITTALREAMEGAEVQSDRMGTTYAVGVVKNHRQMTGKNYFVMHASNFLDLVKELIGLRAMGRKLAKENLALRAEIRALSDSQSSSA